MNRRLTELKLLALRKLAHVSLSIFLIIPYIADLSITGLSTLQYYTILTIASAIIYCIQVKKPIISTMLSEAISNIRNTIIQQLSKLNDSGIINMSIITEHLLKFESSFKEILENVKRDYERRGGYLGILMGMLGVFLSYIIVHDYVIYGIISLIVYDTLSAFYGILIGRTKIPYTHVTLEGTLMGILTYTLILYIFIPQVGILKIITLSIAIGLAECYGIEDNFSIPIVASLITYCLNFPMI